MLEAARDSRDSAVQGVEASWLILDQMLKVVPTVVSADGSVIGEVATYNEVARKKAAQFHGVRRSGIPD